MNLLCLLKNNEVKRILISSELQDNIKSYVQNSIDEFINAGKIKFSGEYKPDEGEVLLIDNFNNPYSDYTNPLNIELLQENEIDEIKSIIFFNNEYIAYQCFDNRKIIKPNKWNLIFSQNTFSKIEHKGLVIDNKIDVLYIINKMELLFLSYHNASKIFDLSDFYKEATDQEINNFCNNNLFDNSVHLTQDNFNKKLRKKIFQIQRNNVLEKVNQNFKQVYNYSKEIGIDNFFNVENNKIEFPTDKKEIEKLIIFLNDDLYKSPISELIYETNSKKLIT